MPVDTALEDKNMKNQEASNTTNSSADSQESVANKPEKKVANEGVKISVKINNFLELIGFTWFIPIVKLLAGEDPVVQLKEAIKVIGVPVLAMLIFIGFWDWGAAKIQTSLGAIPGPAAVLSLIHI